MTRTPKGCFDWKTEKYEKSLQFDSCTLEKKKSKAHQMHILRNIWGWSREIGTKF